MCPQQRYLHSYCNRNWLVEDPKSLDDTPMTDQAQNALKQHRSELEGRWKAEDQIAVEAEELAEEQRQLEATRRRREAIQKAHTRLQETREEL